MDVHMVLVLDSGLWGHFSGYKMGNNHLAASLLNDNGAVGETAYPLV
jgi:hypothetical protein